MNHPLFFISDLQPGEIHLDEDRSKHIIQVLRMEAGEEIMLTDGKGSRALARITGAHRKKCQVTLNEIHKEEKKTRNTCIAISLTKNSSRFEWFLEKATELGISEIIPLICERTEKEKFRYDRMQQVMISAMIQSQQFWLPRLSEPMHFREVVSLEYENRLIAHCLPEAKKEISDMNSDSSAQIILIGPEGDFTPTEIQLAMSRGFTPVNLGPTRLRTETAALVAAVLMRPV